MNGITPSEYATVIHAQRKAKDYGFKFEFGRTGTINIVPDQEKWSGYADNVILARCQTLEEAFMWMEGYMSCLMAVTNGGVERI